MYSPLTTCTAFASRHAPPPRPKRTKPRTCKSLSLRVVVEDALCLCRTTVIVLQYYNYMYSLADMYGYMSLFCLHMQLRLRTQDHSQDPSQDPRRVSCVTYQHHVCVCAATTGLHVHVHVCLLVVHVDVCVFGSMVFKSCPIDL